MLRTDSFTASALDAVGSSTVVFCRQYIVVVIVCVPVMESILGVIYRKEIWDSDLLWTVIFFDAVMTCSTWNLMNIRQNIPVNLYYLTAFVGPDGRTQYRTDIYNYDLTARSSAQIVSKAEQLIR